MALGNLLLAITALQITANALNYAPVIGIVSVPLKIITDEGGFVEPTEEDQGMIPASYEKWIQTSGAQTAFFSMHDTNENFRHFADQVNGLLFVGGLIPWYTKEYYAFEEKVGVAFEIVQEKTKAGVHFPLWGTCLGFQYFHNYIAGENILTPFDAWDLQTRLKPTEAAYTSKMLGNIPGGLDQFVEDALVFHNHFFALGVSTFIENKKVREFFDILSLATDRFERPFVSAFEAKEYPIYAVMFHPEKVGFEWASKNDGLMHDVMSIERAQYYADFFVQEARKNDQTWFSEAEKDRYLGVRFNPHAHLSIFDQLYVIDAEDFRV